MLYTLPIKLFPLSSNDLGKTFNVHTVDNFIMLYSLQDTITCLRRDC